MTTNARRSTTPPPRGRRHTQLGTAPVPAHHLDPDFEPAFSNRPTRVDLGPVIGREPTGTAAASARGEFSIQAVRAVAANVVSGQIDATPKPRARSRSMPPALDEVHLVSATRRELVVMIKGHPITLDRHNALALAAIITSTME